MTRKKKSILSTFFENLSYNDIFDKINPLEITAIFGLALTIKRGVDFTQSKLIAPIARTPGTWKMFPWAYPIQQMIEQGVISKEGNEPIEWLLSFSIAYILIKHFDAVKDLGTNLLSIAKVLLI